MEKPETELKRAFLARLQNDSAMCPILGIAVNVGGSDETGRNDGVSDVDINFRMSLVLFVVFVVFVMILFYFSEHAMTCIRVMDETILILVGTLLACSCVMLLMLMSFVYHSSFFIVMCCVVGISTILMLSLIICMTDKSRMRRGIVIVLVFLGMLIYATFWGVVFNSIVTTALSIMSFIMLVRITFALSKGDSVSTTSTTKP